MITRQQIQSLSTFSGNQYPITSCYLNIDRRQYPQKTYITALKELIKQAQFRIANLKFTTEQMKSVELVVRDGFKSSGYKCSHCGYFNIDNGNCSFCSQPMTAIPDLVEEAVKLAVRRNCEIEYIVNHPIMPELGSIGALLRFK